MTKSFSETLILFGLGFRNEKKNIGESFRPFAIVGGKGGSVSKFASIVPSNRSQIFADCLNTKAPPVSKLFYFYHSLMWLFWFCPQRYRVIFISLQNIDLRPTEYRCETEPGHLTATCQNIDHFRSELLISRNLFSHLVVSFHKKLYLQ